MAAHSIHNFWRKVNKNGPNGCWVWTAATKQAGYGMIGFKTKLCLAHRLSWELHNGPIPNGLCVLHKCDNPPCVNPNHLFLGSRKDNNLDKIKKGRSPNLKGSNSGRAVLIESQILEIRELLKTDLTQQEIGNLYGVSRSTIKEIKCGSNWGWLK